jgi:hypothetical protein
MVLAAPAGKDLNDFCNPDLQGTPRQRVFMGEAHIWRGVMSNSHLNHAIGHGIKEALTRLPPIRDKKNPLIAGLLGFLLGGLGLGLYFRSWADFIVPILVFMGLSIMIPGLGSVAAILFATGWGVVRALASGE